jgi:hypothetical protein
MNNNVELMDIEENDIDELVKEIKEFITKVTKKIILKEMQLIFPIRVKIVFSY